MSSIDWKTAPALLEVQCPVSRLSKESYKERKANLGQTLTGLGKWWGRKPLVLVRATVLGLLLPATDDPRRDREVFLALLTMDDEGVWQRKKKPLTGALAWTLASEDERATWLDGGPDKPRWKRMPAASRELAERALFSRLSHDDKLELCHRPEHLDGPASDAWEKINAHLGTHATSIVELVGELGEKRFGRRPRVGDAFAGGGSIPFESARIGCDVYASDLNPVAALLTWGALHLVGGGAAVAKRVEAAQRVVFDAVDAEVTAWGIEHDERGRRADAYLYCCEARCPECGWLIPLAPSWAIGQKTKTIAELVPVESRKAYDIRIRQGVSDDAMAGAKNAGTVDDEGLHCPRCPDVVTPMTALRGDRKADGDKVYGLRRWEAADLVPRPADVFQERLYCVRWVAKDETRQYAEPTDGDLAREARALALLRERIVDWQVKGHVPNRRIESGDKTDELIRTRGWTHWHHLFTPRQLLLNGAIAQAATAARTPLEERVAFQLGLARCADWNSRLCRWDASPGSEKVAQTFSNQAFNTMASFASKTMTTLPTSWFLELKDAPVIGEATVEIADARACTAESDLWVTDPPYADSISYHELSEYVLAWTARGVADAFPAWPTDSRRALAIRGSGDDFRSSMVDAYRNLARRTSAGGLHCVMFTHQDVGVWADLTLILWAAGLTVTAAWCVQTETEGQKVGNYVQGTVLLVLRAQSGTGRAFLSDLTPQIEDEVVSQLDAMVRLDEGEGLPSFGDADYQLAAYAAALRVLTRYRGVEEIDVERELRRPRLKGGRGRNKTEPSPVEAVIKQAVTIATNHLVPQGIARRHWLRLSADERFYLKGLDVESRSERRVGAFHELARAFGVSDYDDLLFSKKANEARLSTATELEARMLDTGVFAKSLLRRVLFAVRMRDPAAARQYLKDELGATEYWDRRELVIALLAVLERLGLSLPHWAEDSAAAHLLSGAVQADSL